VAEFVLQTDTHPSADEVWAAVRDRCPTLSRATVYNTLHLFAAKGLLSTQTLREGIVAFDPCVEPHHHFIDEESGRIYDVPWSALKVTGEKALEAFEVRDYQVVMRGRRRN
jgi:Fe2+ or Zn2+ uptake regulation protein